METYLWRGLLMVGAAVAASAQHYREEGLRFEEAAWHIARAYNQLALRIPPFGVAKAVGPEDWDPTGEGDPQELQVTIKECRPYKISTLDQCDFNEDDAQKFCSGMYTTEQGYRFILAQCGDTEMMPGAMLRRRWKILQENLIRRFRASGKHYALAIVVSDA